MAWKLNLEHMMDHFTEDKCQEEENSHGTMETFMKEISNSTKCMVKARWHWRIIKFILVIGKTE